MPVKVANISVTVVRDKANFLVPVGVPFDFTEDEVRQVQRSHPLGLRDPVREGRPEANNETDLLRGSKVPEDADKTGDTNLLSRAKAKAGGNARNQGGSSEEDEL